MHTHRLTLDGEVVRNRFVSWSDAEPEHEWAGLTALACGSTGSVGSLRPSGW